MEFRVQFKAEDPNAYTQISLLHKKPPPMQLQVPDDRKVSEDYEELPRLTLSVFMNNKGGRNAGEHGHHHHHLAEDMSVQVSYNRDD